MVGTKHKRPPAQHYREESEKRASLILEQLDRLGKLSNRSTNEFTPEQTQELFGVLRARLDFIEGLFSEEHAGKQFRYSSQPELSL